MPRGIVCDKSIRVAGDDFTSDIEEYMRRQHNILIGERTAEQIKIEVGAAIDTLENPLKIMLLEEGIYDRYS